MSDHFNMLDVSGPSSPSTTKAGSILTPDTSTVTPSDVWDGRRYAVPWPGCSYLVIKKGTNKAIALTGRGLLLQEINDDQNPDMRWYCVEQAGYFGLQTPQSGYYIGHEGPEHGQFVAKARHHKQYECLNVRQHPSGGYQLLSPYYDAAMKTVSVMSDGTLVRAQYGEDLWLFVQL